MGSCQNTGVVAISCSRGSSPPRDQTQASHISCTGGWVLYHLGSHRHWYQPVTSQGWDVRLHLFVVEICSHLFIMNFDSVMFIQISREMRTGLETRDDLRLFPGRQGGWCRHGRRCLQGPPVRVPTMSGRDITGMSVLQGRTLGSPPFPCQDPCFSGMMHMALASKDDDQVLPSEECGVQGGSGWLCHVPTTRWICLFAHDIIYAELFTFYRAFKIQGCKKTKY